MTDDRRDRLNDGNGGKRRQGYVLYVNTEQEQGGPLFRLDTLEEARARKRPYGAWLRRAGVLSTLSDVSIAIRRMTCELDLFRDGWCIEWDSVNRCHALVELLDRLPEIGHGRAALSPSERFAILKRDGYRCQICGQSAADGARLEVDHKRPVCRGGTNVESNLWTLCFECNRGKATEEL